MTPTHRAVEPCPLRHMLSSTISQGCTGHPCVESNTHATTDHNVDVREACHMILVKFVYQTLYIHVKPTCMCILEKIVQEDSKREFWRCCARWTSSCRCWGSKPPSYWIGTVPTCSPPSLNWRCVSGNAGWDVEPCFKIAGRPCRAQSPIQCSSLLNPPPPNRTVVGELVDFSFNRVCTCMK